MPGNQRCTVDVLLLLVREGQVLLGLRQGTGFADGMWNLPSGKAEDGENAVAAVIREAREEVGIDLTARDVRFTAAVHCRNSDTDMRMGLFFHATAGGEPFNAEPHKCAKIAWHPLEMLPEPMMPYSELGICLYRKGLAFGTLGW